MSIAVCPAENWWAVLQKQEALIKVKVAYFEIELGEAPMRRVMVYHPGQKRMVDVLALGALQSLEYEASTDPSRKVEKSDLLEFLKNNGANFAEEDLKKRVNNGLIQRAVELYVDEAFEAFVDKEEL